MPVSGISMQYQVVTVNRCKCGNIVKQVVQILGMEGGVPVSDRALYAKGTPRPRSNGTRQAHALSRIGLDRDSIDYVS